jgi:hypothetical protein
MILLAAGAAAVLVLLAAPASPLAKRAAAVDGWTGTTWAPDKPRVPYYATGGLYHPPVAGEGRCGLLKHGWAWIADPPSERTGPGTADA